MNAYTGGVCVADCPDLTNQTEDGLTDIRTMITYNGTWQTSDGSAQLDPDFLQVADYSNSSDAITCTDELCFPDDAPAASWNSRGVNEGFGFAYYAATTYDALWRCYVTTAATDRIAEQVNATFGVPDELDFGIGALDSVYEVGSW